MHIVHVIPIARGIGKETLTYFSAQEYPLGSMIKVPLRNRTIPALVMKHEPVSEVKTELRQQDFTVRKIGRSKMVPLFSPHFIAAAEDAAKYYAGSTGAVLAEVTSKVILEQSEKIKFQVFERTERQELELSQQPYAMQADEGERLAHYKSLIREQFARKRSVFFCLPTIQDTKKIFETLPKGIEKYTFVLNSSLTKKELLTAWNASLNDEHPVLIIATGAFLGIPRHDIGTIIIERESSSNYKAQGRPFVDIRRFAEFFAKRLKAKLIFGDHLLRTETLWRTKNGELGELSPLKFRSISTAEVSIVDMKKYKTLDTPEFRILSDELENLIKSNKEHSGNMFIYAARRGLSPMTICGDCGTTVLCSRCSAPIILHHDKGENFFLCHRCGERRSAEERCKMCESWRLTTLGIGIELIENVIREMFPDLTLFRMDKDSVKTHKQATSIAARFYNAPGSVLLGTEMALLYLERPIENAAVAAIDSLFSIPDFRVNEKIMNTILKIRSITQKKFIVQTRTRDQHIFDHAVKGNLLDFYRQEIDERKKLNYPPFVTLIKITIKGTKQRVGDDIHLIESRFKEYEPLIFPAFIETVNKKVVMHALIRVKQHHWIIEPLAEKLRSLPPHIAVNIDPESLL